MSAMAIVPPLRSATLYEVTDELATLLDSLDLTEEGSRERSECEAAIASYFDQLPAKVDAVAARLHHLQSQAEFARQEIARLRTRQQHFERQSERLEEYCIRALQRLPQPRKGPRKIEGRSNTLALRASESVALVDEARVPADYKTASLKLPVRLWRALIELAGRFGPPELPQLFEAYRAEEVVSKDAVKKALKAGTIVPGADLEFRDNLKVS